MKIWKIKYLILFNLLLLLSFIPLFNILNTSLIKPIGFFKRVVCFFANSYLTMFKWESFKASLWFIFIFIDNIEIKLASASLCENDLEDWKKSILEFLGEDKVIVESVHKSYLENFKLGPPNRLEQRIIHWQNIYKDFLNASGISF